MYDPAEKIASISHQDNLGSWFANYVYSYNDPSTGNPDGRLRTETYNGGAPVTYTYDVVDQLTGDGTTTYGFDNAGNRNTNGFSTPAGSDNRMQTDGVWTYTYDPEGNLTKKTKGPSAETWTYGYDNANHLLWTERRATDGGTLLLRDDFKYDVNGQRIEKDVWTGSTVTTRFAYDRGNVWVDLDGSNNPLARRLYTDAVDQVFARITYSGGTATAAWYLQDREGSVRDLANATGAAQDHITYDGFGNVVSETNSSFSDRYKYTGREFDSEIGLQYNRARYYDPKAGRWLSEDPLGFDAADPNLYRYVQNDPTNGTDPSGQFILTKRNGDQKAWLEWLWSSGIDAVGYPISGGYAYIHIPYADRTRFQELVGPQNDAGDPGGWYKSVRGSVDVGKHILGDGKFNISSLKLSSRQLDQIQLAIYGAERVSFHSGPVDPDALLSNGTPSVGTGWRIGGEQSAQEALMKAPGIINQMNPLRELPGAVEEADRWITKEPPRSQQYGAMAYTRGVGVGLYDSGKELAHGVASLPHLITHPDEFVDNLKALGNEIRRGLTEQDIKALRNIDPDLYRLVSLPEYNMLTDWEQGRLTTRVVIRYATLVELGYNGTKLVAQLGRKSLSAVKSIANDVVQGAKSKIVRVPESTGPRLPVPGENPSAPTSSPTLSRPENITPKRELPEIEGRRDLPRTMAHQVSQETIAEMFRESGRYKRVAMGEPLSSFSGQKHAPNIEPDVMGLRHDGRIDMAEVVSPSQTAEQLRAKLDKAMKQLPPAKRGDIFIHDPAGEKP